MCFVVPNTLPQKCSLPPQPPHPPTRQNNREKHKSGLWYFNQRPALHHVYFLSYWSQGLGSQTLLPGGCRPTQIRAWSSSLTSAAEPGAQILCTPPPRPTSPALCYKGVVVSARTSSTTITKPTRVNYVF